jgi:hypothetical protein
VDRQLTEEELREEIGKSEVFLRRESETLLSTGTLSKRDRTLSLTGLEPLLLFLAQKIVIPIVCSFVNKVLWEKYKGLKSKANAKAALQDLGESKVRLHPQVPKEDVISMLTAELVSEGVDVEVASHAVAHGYARLAARYL